MSSLRTPQINRKSWHHPLFILSAALTLLVCPPAALAVTSNFAPLDNVSNSTAQSMSNSAAPSVSNSDATVLISSKELSLPDLSLVEANDTALELGSILDLTNQLLQPMIAHAWQQPSSQQRPPAGTPIPQFFLNDYNNINHSQSQQNLTTITQHHHRVTATTSAMATDTRAQEQSSTSESSARNEKLVAKEQSLASPETTKDTKLKTAPDTQLTMASALASHAKPALASHAKPALASHAEPALASHAEPALASHAEPALASHAEPALASHLAPAPTEHAASTPTPTPITSTSTTVTSAATGTTASTAAKASAVAEASAEANTTEDTASDAIADTATDTVADDSDAIITLSKSALFTREQHPHSMSYHSGSLPFSRTTGLDSPTTNQNLASHLPEDTSFTCPLPPEQQAKVAILFSGSYREFDGIFRHMLLALHNDGYLKSFALAQQHNYSVLNKLAYKQLQEATKGSCIEFVDNGVLDFNWTQQGILDQKEMIKERINKGEINMIWAFGTLAGLYFGDSNLNIPVLVIDASSSTRSGLSGPGEFSKRRNIHVQKDLYRHISEFVMFYNQIHFKRLGILIDRNADNQSAQGAPDIRVIAKDMGVQLVPCYTDLFGKNPQTATSDFKRCMNYFTQSNIDALFLSLGYRPQEPLFNYLKPLLDRGIPIYSQQGADEVRAGALFALSGTNEQYAGMFEANVIEQVMQGVPPEKISQYFQGPATIAFNMQTARLLEWQPSFTTMLAIDQVFTKIETDYISTSTVFNTGNHAPKEIEVKSN